MSQAERKKADQDYLREDLAFMKEPTRWPAWPFLPMKKPNKEQGWPDNGVLLDSGELGKGTKVEPIIYRFNIFGDVPFDRSKITKKYDSLEAVQADGWQVD